MVIEGDVLRGEVMGNHQHQDWFWWCTGGRVHQIVIQGGGWTILVPETLSEAL